MSINNDIDRILTITWEYPPHIEGGLGRHVADLTPAIAELGVKVEVVTPISTLVAARPYGLNRQTKYVLGGGKTAEEFEQNITVDRVPVNFKASLHDIYGRVMEANQAIETHALNRYLAHTEPPLIHTHDWLTGPASIALRDAWGVELVATIHATELGRARGHLHNDLQRAIDRVERELIKKADKIIVCSHHMFRELQTFFQVPAEKMAIVPNGVDVAGLQQQNSFNPTSFRARYAQPSEQLVFSIARLVYEKGIHRLIDATRRVLSECPNVKFVIAGRGPEAENLQHQAAAMGVADRVHFVGFISDLERNRLFKVADCAVFPSLYEPFGIVALEAMALGCPVIVSEVGGLLEVVTHQKTGFTVYPDDPNSIAWGITKTLTQPEMTAQYVSRARTWVEENFTWNKIAQQTIDVYQQLLQTT